MVRSAVDLIFSDEAAAEATIASRASKQTAVRGRTAKGKRIFSDLFLSVNCCRGRAFGENRLLFASEGATIAVDGQEVATVPLQVRPIGATDPGSWVHQQQQRVMQKPWKQQINLDNSRVILKHPQHEPFVSELFLRIKVFP